MPIPKNRSCQMVLDVEILASERPRLTLSVSCNILCPIPDLVAMPPEALLFHQTMVEYGRYVYLREFTFPAWLKTATDDLNNRRIFLLSDGEHCYALQGNTRAGVGVYVADGVELNEYGWRFAEGTWTHISVTHDGHNLSIYRNGRLTEAGNIETSGVKGTLYIGGTDLHRGGFWYGAIDEVALFSRSVTICVAYLSRLSFP